MRLSIDALNAAQASDFSEPKTFKPIEPGFYKATVMDAEVRNSKSGSDYVNLKLELTDALDKKVGTIFQVLFTNSTSKFCIEDCMMFVSSLGIEADDSEISDTQLCELAKNQQVIVRTEIERSEYNGQKRERAKVAHGAWYGIDSDYMFKVSGAATAQIANDVAETNDPFVAF